VKTKINTRLHFAIGDEPVKEGETVTVPCELELQKVHREFVWDALKVGETFEMPATTLTTCRECFNKMLLGKWRYCCGVRDGRISGQDGTVTECATPQ